MFHRIVRFDKAAQRFHDYRPREQLAEKIDLLFQLGAGNRFEELFRRGASLRVELRYLLRHRARHLQGVAFTGKVRDKPRLLRAFSFHCAPGEEQITDKTVSDVAPETGNAAKAGNESQAQFGKAEAGHLIGNNQVANQREFQTSAHAQTMHRGECDERRVVNRIGHGVDALQKGTNARKPLRLW